MKKTTTLKSFLKKHIMLILVAALSFMMFIGATASEQAVYITSANDMLELMNTTSAWNKNYILKNNIDLSDYEGELTQNPIGSSSSPFSGTFDGGGYTISGLDLVNYTKRSSMVALFGCISNATIKNLSVSGEVSAKVQDVGGIVAIAKGGSKIINCTNLCNVSGTKNIGGVVARTISSIDGIQILNCTNKGNVKGSSQSIGGVLGAVNNASGPLTIKQCINTGSITGTLNVGGVVGLFNATPGSSSTLDVLDYILSECINDGTVTTTCASGEIAYAGGIVGFYKLTTISDCLNMGTVVSENGAIRIGGSFGGNEGSGGTIERCVDRGKVVSSATHRNVGQFVGYPVTKPTGICYYTYVSDGAGGGRNWDNVTKYSESAFDTLNTNGVWTVTTYGPMLTFAARDFVEEIHIGALGDYDKDLRVSIADALIALNMIANDNTVGQIDANGDGKFSLLDVLRTIKRSVSDEFEPISDLAGDFTILIAGNWASNDFASTDNESSKVNAAINRRNSYLMDEYGINIVTENIISLGSTSGSGIGYETLYNEYMAGKSSYDASMMGAMDAVSLAYKGILHDLSNIPTIDLTSDIWDQNIIKDLSVNGRTYFASGDISYLDDASANVIFFSEKTHKALGLESIYELVRDDNWTLEKYYNMIKSAPYDVDDDGTYTNLDRIGLLADNANSIAMLAAADEKLAAFDNGGSIQLTLKNDKTVELYDTYRSVVQTPGYALNWERDDDWSSTGGVATMMNDSRALFWSRTLLNFRNLKNGNADYGVVPYPKYDASQENYGTLISAYASQYLVVPEMSENFDKAGKIVTLLAETGKDVENAFRTDVATKADGTVDSDILEMLEIINSSSSYDIGILFDPRGLATLTERLVYSEETLSDIYAERGGSAQVFLDMVSLLLEEHKDASPNHNILKHFDRHSEWFEETTTQNIEQYRKGDATITVTDADGNVIPNAKVSVTQDTHEFNFGANIFMLDEFETEEKNEEYRERFKEIFNMATLPFYWDATEPEEGVFRFDKDSPKLYRRPAIDLCMEYCEENGIEPREHGLVYNSAFPAWVNKNHTVDEEWALVEKRMKEISERYSNRIPTIEVTNETFYGTSVKSDIYNQDDFVERSFALAEKYFPSNTLCSNEGSSVWTKPTHISKYWKYVNEINAQNKLIDAVGMQYHVFCKDRDTLWRYADELYNPVILWHTMNTFAELNIDELHITEITIPALSNSPEDEQMQADLIEKLYTLWFAHPKVEEIVYWNLVDGYAHKAPIGDMTAGENVYYAGLIRFDMTPKPAYYTLKELLYETWHTEEDIITNNGGVATFRGFYGDYTVEVEIDGVVTTHSLSLSKGSENSFIIKAQ